MAKEYAIPVIALGGLLAIALSLQAHAATSHAGADVQACQGFGSSTCAGNSQVSAFDFGANQTSTSLSKPIVSGNASASANLGSGTLSATSTITLRNQPNSPFNWDTLGSSNGTAEFADWFTLAGDIHSYTLIPVTVTAAYDGVVQVTQGSRGYASVSVSLSAYRHSDIIEDSGHVFIDEIIDSQGDTQNGVGSKNVSRTLSLSFNVYPGDPQFHLGGSLSAVAGGNGDVTASADAGHTFRLTSIDLPAGITYTKFH